MRSKGRASPLPIIIQPAKRLPKLLTPNSTLLTFIGNQPDKLLFIYAFCRINHCLGKYSVSSCWVIKKNISKLMIPTPQSPQHSAKYSGKSPYFGRLESELTCSVRSLSISNTNNEVNYEYHQSTEHALLREHC